MLMTGAPYYPILVSAFTRKKTSRLKSAEVTKRLNLHEQMQQVVAEKVALNTELIQAKDFIKYHEKEIEETLRRTKPCSSGS